MKHKDDEVKRLEKSLQEATRGHIVPFVIDIVADLFTTGAFSVGYNFLLVPLLVTAGWVCVGAACVVFVLWKSMNFPKANK